MYLVRNFILHYSRQYVSFKGEIYSPPQDQRLELYLIKCIIKIVNSTSYMQTHIIIFNITRVEALGSLLFILLRVSEP